MSALSCRSPCDGIALPVFPAFDAAKHLLTANPKALSLTVALVAHRLGIIDLVIAVPQRLAGQVPHAD